MSANALQIGGWLRNERKRHGEYSAEQAAVKVGTTGRTMGTWERGEVAPPTDTFFALVELYRADVAALLNGKPPRDYEAETRAAELAAEADLRELGKEPGAKRRRASGGRGR